MTDYNDDDRQFRAEVIEHLAAEGISAELNHEVYADDTINPWTIWLDDPWLRIDGQQCRWYAFAKGGNWEIYAVNRQGVPMPDTNENLHLIAAINEEDLSDAMCVAHGIMAAIINWTVKGRN